MEKDIMKIEDIRHSFRPAEIRVLFVGESAPQSGKFFYKGNSQVYGYMEKYLGQKLFQTCNNFLENFKAASYYLDDLVLTPVTRRLEINKSDCVYKQFLL